MSSSIPIIQHLTTLSTSPLYCKQIPLSTHMNHFPDFKCQHEIISNNIEIIPPSVWFSIEETKCYNSIKNDIERSRVTRDGVLLTNVKGNVLNRICYQGFQEDLGALQEVQQAFCVGFVVVKDGCEDFLKYIGVELRACLGKKPNLIDRSHLKISQLDQISKQIYNKYRVFLIFDTKSQPGRVMSFHSCFYPHINFNLQKIKKKQGYKFASNEVMQQIQRGELINNFGFLSLDNKMRLTMIKKNDPALSEDNIIGVWVITSYPITRNKKQFAKDDAIWIALLDFYTNNQIKSKLSIMVKEKGLLCYFNFKKERSKLDSPQFYLFQPSTRVVPKWSFVTKNQVLSDSNKACEVKIQFINSTIVQQKQYSQFSDQTIEKLKNENINRQNISSSSQVYNTNTNNVNREKQKEKQKEKQRDFNRNNNKGYHQLGVEYGTVQAEGQVSKNYENISRSRIQEEDQRDKIIRELRVELERYKMKCMELEAMNKILMQEKMMNPMMYNAQFSMINPMNPSGFPYPNFSYPLSYSQVSSQNPYPSPSSPINQHNQQQSPTQQLKIPQQIPSNLPIPSSSASTPKINNKVEQLPSKQSQQIKKPISYFPESKEQEITFGTQPLKQNQDKIVKSVSISSLKIGNVGSGGGEKLFLKKSQSYGQQGREYAEEQQKHQYEVSTQKPKGQKQKIQLSKQALSRKDMRNISFQDSFAEYHSEGEEEVPVFKTSSSYEYQQRLQKVKENKAGKTFKFGQFESNKKSKNILQDYQQQTGIYQRSPQFKKNHSLQTNSLTKQIDADNIRKQYRKQERQTTQILKQRHKTEILQKDRKQDDSDQQVPRPIKMMIKQQNYIKAKSPINSPRQQAQNREKQRQREEIKKEYKKNMKVSSGSEDSDQDVHLKQIRKNYLKR